MSKQKLIEHLNIARNETNHEWMLGLEKRKIEELNFHDKHRDGKLEENLPKDTYDKLYGNKKFYRTVKLSSGYIESWVNRHSQGKVFLDYACGNGMNTIRAAKAGAELAIGLDISDISVKNAQKLAKEEGVLDNTYFLQGDCENTGLPSECIDICICSGMLHHLDLSYAFFELRRILRPGGIILCIEALDYNPIIKLYRNITPQMRTEWEKNHILSYKDIIFAERFFDVKDIKHWHLFSIAGAYFPFALQIFNALDSLFLKLPIIKTLSWMFTFELHKRAD
jgi:ubiquinone/menaquinone biosynthesis C-methylase UbiE